MSTPRRSQRSARVSDDDAPAGSVIEIVGPAGIGKSTVLPAVVARLREQLDGVGVVAVSPDRDTSDIGRLQRLWALVASPGWCIAAMRIAAGASGSRMRALRRWIAILATMAASRRRAARDGTVAVIEQATVQFLRRGSSLERLHSLMLPDLAVELNAHPAVVLRRRLERDKPPNRGEMLRGEQRAAQAERLAWRLADLDAHDATHLIRAWSDRFCDPPLHEADLLSAITRGRARSEPEDPENHWSGRTIRTAIRDRVTWIVIDNSEGNSLIDVADAVYVEVRRFIDEGSEHPSG